MDYITKYWFYTFFYKSSEPKDNKSYITLFKHIAVSENFLKINISEQIGII